MKLQELTSADAVIAAIDEVAKVGRAAFLNRYGFKKATKFFVVHDGECFDSKAVAGVAFGYQFPSAGALTSNEFSGGRESGQAASVLESLGFEVVSRLDPSFVVDRISAAIGNVGGLPGGGRTLHKPALLEHLITRLEPDSTRLRPTNEVARALLGDLQKYMPGVKSPNPYEPIWRLEPDVWELRDGDADPRPSFPSDPPTHELASGHWSCGLEPALFVTLRDDEELRSRVTKLLSAWLSDPQPSKRPNVPKRRTFGEIEGVPAGTNFPTRRALADAGVHRPLEAGICGGQEEGAESILLNGGYEDDEDYGTEIIYTGHGGRDITTKKQTADQELVHGNKALARSHDEGSLVRVVRGPNGDPQFSPKSGFTYAGAFRVASYFQRPGKEGFLVWQFLLVADSPTALTTPSQATNATPSRVSVTTQRIVRNTELGSYVKQLYDFTCQICAHRITTPNGGYAEAAHIRPLGRPHNGPDVESNLLCLCANCHVLFDKLAIYIDDNLAVWSRVAAEPLGQLRTHRRHEIGRQHLTYHRELRPKG